VIQWLRPPDWDYPPIEPIARRRFFDLLWAGNVALSRHDPEGAARAIACSYGNPDMAEWRSAVTLLGSTLERFFGENYRLRYEEALRRRLTIMGVGS